jgi:hypothetical protein
MELNATVKGSPYSDLKKSSCEYHGRGAAPRSVPRNRSRSSRS